MRHRVVVVGLGVWLAVGVGCESRSIIPQVWVMPPGGSETDYKKDNYECWRDAMMATQGMFAYSNPDPFMDAAGARSAVNQRDRMYATCMTSKGYVGTSRAEIEKRKASSPAPSDHPDPPSDMRACAKESMGMGVAKELAFEDCMKSKGH